MKQAQEYTVILLIKVCMRVNAVKASSQQEAIHWVENNIDQRTVFNKTCEMLNQGRSEKDMGQLYPYVESVYEYEDLDPFYIVRPTKDGEEIEGENCWEYSPKTGELVIAEDD